ncbi:MAG: metallophosphoesterase [Desulfobacteraceae bacterium]|nr:metallophosphoesterase [Desulfobacteraceae bacterium]
MDTPLSKCAREIVRQTRIILSPGSPDNTSSDKDADSPCPDQNISKGNTENRVLHILHLSDIHLDTHKKTEIYLSQLSVDLKLELKVDKLDYVVLSGDVVNHSTPDEYKAAFDFVTRLAKELSIDLIRIQIRTLLKFISTFHTDLSPVS